GNRQAVSLEAERGHEVHVLAPPVVVIAGHVAGMPAEDGAGPAAQHIPHREALAVRVSAAFDLVGSRRGPPDEAGGKGVRSGPRRSRHDLDCTFPARAAAVSGRRAGAPGGRLIKPASRLSSSRNRARSWSSLPICRSLLND